MPVAATDIKCAYSGGLANTDPDLSIGEKMSSVVITDNVLENLFDNVSPAEATAGDTEYRCFYLLNDHATDDADDVTIWIQTQTASASTVIAIGLDPAGIGDGDTTGEADNPANENTAPTGVTFSAPTNLAGGLVIGQLNAGEAQAVWVRRIVSAAAAAVANDPFALRVSALPL